MKSVNTDTPTQVTVAILKTWFYTAGTRDGDTWVTWSPVDKPKLDDTGAWDLADAHLGDPRARIHGHVGLAA